MLGNLLDKKRVNKRGELTSRQIVIIVILIISFAVIMLFYFRFDWKSETDKELCYNSVVNRGLIPVGKEMTSLNCKTQQICLTMGGECLDAPSNAKEIKVKNEEEIIKEIANEMYDCWWMMGSGEINYAAGLDYKTVYCAICSNIYFDEEIQKQSSTINYGKLYSYLASENIPNKKQTYAEYLYDTNNLQEIGKKEIAKRRSLFSANIETNKHYAIVTGIMEEETMAKLVKDAAIGGGVGAVIGTVVAANFWNPVGWIIGGVATLGGAGTAILINQGELVFLSPSLIPNDAVSDLECKDFGSLY